MNITNDRIMLKTVIDGLNNQLDILANTSDWSNYNRNWRLGSLGDKLNRKLLGYVRKYDKGVQ